MNNPAARTVFNLPPEKLIPLIRPATSKDLNTQLWRQHYKPAIQELRTQNPLDTTTIPSDFEKENLLTQFRKIMGAKFSNLDYDIKKRIESEIFFDGPLEPLLTDSDITEICVNGHKSIWYEKAGTMFEHTDCFYDSISFNNFLIRMTTECRIHANLQRPFADGVWRDFRVHLIIPPLTQAEAHISLRRHPENPWTFKRLEEAGWASSEELRYIDNLIQKKSSFLVIGATGTGKTSLLNACLQRVGHTERVIAIEDTSELRLPNQLSVKLVSRTDAQGLLTEVSLMELLRQSMRMRPDRIVMGEVRGAEAKDLLMTLSTGHNGGMATLHADNPRQALIRLEMLIQLGAPQWALQAIRNLIFFGLKYIITVKRENGKRKLHSIHRLSSLEDSGFLLEQIEIN